MRMFMLAAAAVCALSAGCATEPPPCTSEWVQWKKDRVLKAFAADHRREINSLRDMAASFEGDDEPSDALMSMTLATVGVLALAADFVEEAAPAVRQAVAQCGSAPRAAQLFAEMLREEGVSDDAVRAIERLGALVETNRVETDR